MMVFPASGLPPEVRVAVSSKVSPVSSMKVLGERVREVGERKIIVPETDPEALAVSSVPSSPVYVIVQVASMETVVSVAISGAV